MTILVNVRHVKKIQKAKARKPNGIILKILLKNITSPYLPPPTTGHARGCL